MLTATFGTFGHFKQQEKSTQDICLNLSNAGITDYNINNFLPQIKKCHSELDLSNNNIGEKGIKKLVDFCVKKKLKIDTLNLTANNIDDPAIMHLTQIKSLTHLYLDANRLLTDSGIKNLSIQNPKLELSSLENPQIKIK
jgi:hypothetical protein